MADVRSLTETKWRLLRTREDDQRSQLFLYSFSIQSVASFCILLDYLNFLFANEKLTSVCIGLTHLIEDIIRFFFLEKSKNFSLLSFFLGILDFRVSPGLDLGGVPNFPKCCWSRVPDLFFLYLIHHCWRNGYCMWNGITNKRGVTTIISWRVYQKTNQTK